MTVCLVRSSSELLQGGPESGRPFSAQRNRPFCVRREYQGVKTALVDEDYPLFSSRGGHSAHSFVFLIYVDTSAQRNRPFCVLEPVSQNATVDIKILVYKRITQFFTNFFAWKKTFFYLFFGDAKLSS